VAELTKTIEQTKAKLSSLRAEISTFEQNQGEGFEVLKELKEKQHNLEITNKKLRCDLAIAEQDMQHLVVTLRCAYELLGWLQDEAEKAVKDGAKLEISPEILMYIKM